MRHIVAASFLCWVAISSVSVAASSSPRPLDLLFRMILHLQKGESEKARKLIGKFPEPRPILVRRADGVLGPWIGGSTRTFAQFAKFPKDACRLIKLTPQSDNLKDQNAYDIFFDCQGEGKAMQVTLAERLIAVVDFADIVIAVEPQKPEKT